MRFSRALGMAMMFWIAIGAIALWLGMRQGLFSNRVSPGRIESFVARRLRDASIPSQTKSLQNPLARDPEAWREGMAEFAEHCAMCHDPDGRGRGYVARHLDPPAPDLTQAATQRLPDGALYGIIMNGVRWTGMPAWGGEVP